MGFFKHRGWIFLWLTSICFVTGCASNDLSDAALSGDPEAMWVDGQKQVKRGEALVREGEASLAEGREQVRSGETLLDSGNSSTLEARQDYQNAAMAMGQASSPDGLAKEAKRLKVIGDRWEDAIDDLKDGSKLVAKGNKAIDRGQSEIRQGRALIESGSTLMRNSQRLRTGVELLKVPASPS